ncbi:MAG: RsmB/NOP family class I SAM-dependent RNA methyltransferase [Oligoflexia bacterium]|nr:RsmB/NOP family class I SAM-dependent RNA methyltransferase [Oligoflexia bacterium]
MVKQTTKLRGEAAFDLFYLEVFGTERWPKLKQALLEEKRPVARENLFAKDNGNDTDTDTDTDKDNLHKYYSMDLASIWAAQALMQVPIQTPIADEEKASPTAPIRVLDLCAAPGGKSLILAEGMSTKNVDGEFVLQGELILNERSAARRARLLRTLNDYLPANIRAKIKVYGHDASSWCVRDKSDGYDRILLDAPCSSERHLLLSSNKSHMADWSKKRTQCLCREQYAMLVSGLQVLRPGGCLLYSTCALSPLENDGLVARLEQRFFKRRGSIEILRPTFPQGEATKYGWWILPDQCEGLGPMFLALFRRSS